MAYKKPEVIAKSEVKQSFVAGCPEQRILHSGCASMNQKCMIGNLK